MAIIFITGGTGFIGSHIVEALLGQGHQLRVLTSKTTVPPNIAPYQEQLELLQGDFGNQPLMEKYLQGVDYLIHVAWTTVPKTATEQPIYDAQSNLIGGLHLLEAAVTAQVKKVLFISTGGALYGVPQYVPVDEAHPLQPISAYGISKLSFERYLHFYYKNKGLDYSIFRIANAYGPRQNLTKNQGVIGIWLQKIQQQHPIQIWGDGSVIRDYIYVADVAQLIAQSLTYQGTVKTFNVGSGQGYSLNDILAVCQSISQQQPTIEYLKGRAFDVPVNILSIERVQAVLGWSPSTSLEKGIQATWDWLLLK